ncbi:MAG TPA: hypothetical protein VG146_16465 [Verrucomicrobiae bacterium]|nr:hypothetical protein [Verrucomicrobiae bacterium]
MARAEEITITKHEKPVARLVPFEKPSRVELAKLFNDLDAFGSKHPLLKNSLIAT